MIDTKSTFITNNFLLENKYAQQLYHDYAAEQPIIDYHCHLPPAEIANDRVYDNISQVWIAGDHYKWRAMRTLGIDERFITGDATDKEKFLAWAKTVPYTLRNPLYHWTHLELKRYFGVNELLNEDNAEEIYNEVNEQLQQPENSCRGLLTQMNVETVCTTEGPVDDLKHHQALQQTDFPIHVSTAFRPDKVITIGADGFNDFIDDVAEAAEIEINSFDDLKQALQKRIDYFHSMGCRLSDHGLNYISYQEFSESEIEDIFSRKRKNNSLTTLEKEKYQTAVMLFLSQQYHKYGWVQQFHLGALRNNNQRMLDQLGPDTGWDSIGDFPQATTMSKFFDNLDSRNQLTKTIIYNLNPADNEIFASMIGNYNDGSIKGKFQFGSAWWFLDQKDGIIKQLNALSNMGLISCFIGMLTDSRSFLSYPRHEYFRRVLCNLFGQEIASGELPNDMNLIGNIITDICYHNAKEYFDFK